MVRARTGLAIVTALVALLFAFAAGAQSSRDAQRKLDRAQRELKSVAAERRKIEGQRGDASKQLRAVDEQLGHSSRALHDTEAQLARERATLAQLQQRRADMESRLGAQRGELATLLRAAYTVGSDAPLKLLLAQDRVADASRVLTWHRYLQRDRAQRITALAAELRELDALEQRIAEQQRALDAARERQRTQLAQLQSDRKQRAQTVAQLDTRYQDKRSREKALGSDVAGLKKLLAQLRAAAARAEAERRAAAERAARAARETGKQAQPRQKPQLIAKAAPIDDGGLGSPQ
jgi:septal ring factor EnvC (AmiA/AmiB activator)